MMSIIHEWDLAAPCQASCPAGIDVPSYLALIAHGRVREAVDLIRRDNPFPWICGLVCPAPCQRACVKGYQDAPLAIRALKGFAAALVERGADERVVRKPERRRGKVAIIGAGPAGLTAAHDLALQDFEVTVYEALPVAGGMMAVGIPEYRLPREVLAEEIRRIESLGVDLRLDTPVGGDLTLERLRAEGTQAFFVATGAHHANITGIAGESEYSQVTSAIAFLRRQQIGDRGWLGRRVVVIGGGNCAVDSARTSRRLGSEVTLVYRRTREEMPALDEEIEQAAEEGVQIEYLTIPTRVIGDGSHVTGLEIIRAELGAPDHSGRRRPVPSHGTESIIPTDGVIVAVGQRPDLSWLSPGSRLDSNRYGSIEVNSSTLHTSLPDVFAGGDAVLGPATVIEAVAMGKQAARSILGYLRDGRSPDGPSEPKPRSQVVPIELEGAEKAHIEPLRPTYLPLESRLESFDQVERELTSEEARREASRCLRCDLCIGCGDCAKVCRTKLEVDALRFIDAGGARVVIADLLRPAERCIGCGSCVGVCPTGCLSLVEDGDERRLVKCGTTLARLELAPCSTCGRKFAPKRYLAYIDKVLGRSKEPLCPDCARQAAGAKLAAGESLSG